MPKIKDIKDAVKKVVKAKVDEVCATCLGAGLVDSRLCPTCNGGRPKMPWD